LSALLARRLWAAYEPLPGAGVGFVLRVGSL
jgi:hypothetical protein